MTVVIIAHRLSTIKNVNKIYVIEKGRIIQSGCYDELVMNENSRFRKMVDIQTL